MDVECRVCKFGLMVCCDDHLYCSERCFNQDNVEHVGVLEGVRGLSNFEDKLTAFFGAMSNLRDAAVNSTKNFNLLSGSLKDVQMRASYRQNVNKAEIEVAKTAYAVGAMLDGIRLAGKTKYTSKPSASWNAVLLKEIPAWLNILGDDTQSVVDMGALFDQIRHFLNDDSRTVVIALELVQDLSKYLSVPWNQSPAGRASAHQVFLSSVKTTAKKYDTIYKEFSQGAKAEVKDAKKAAKK